MFKRRAELLAVITVLVLLVSTALVACAEKTPTVKPEAKPPAKAVSTAAEAAGYVGTEKCAQCHPKEYNTFRVTGHPWKLKTAEVAKDNPLPLPAGYTWSDISYVVGGYKWKARYLDKKGYIITTTAGQPGKNQYNLMAGTWSDYEAGKEKKYDCGNCHNTGYSKEGSQGGLEGVVGTWAFEGIQCEACHGPGKTHVDKGGDRAAIKIDRSAAACGACHVRGKAEQVPAKGGFIQHHEQYNELLASPHKALQCVTCHDPHKKAEFSVKIGADCVGCHSNVTATFTGSQMQKMGVTCTDCHMPMATRSAVSLGFKKGDIKTHIFRINTDPTASMFTDNDTLARNFLTMDFACLACHQGKNAEWASKNAKGAHTLGK